MVQLRLAVRILQQGFRFVEVYLRAKVRLSQGKLLDVRGRSRLALRWMRS
jgi:hypothetical protein